jgi:hypothetical protein
VSLRCVRTVQDFRPYYSCQQGALSARLHPWPQTGVSSLRTSETLGAKEVLSSGSFDRDKWTNVSSYSRRLKRRHKNLSRERGTSRESSKGSRASIRPRSTSLFTLLTMKHHMLSVAKKPLSFLQIIVLLSPLYQTLVVFHITGQLLLLIARSCLRSGLPPLGSASQYT